MEEENGRDDGEAMTSHQIHEVALDKHTALLGMTGSGKTSVAKSAIVEPDLEAGRRVIVIDPTSAWWGLRLTKNGKGKGFPIYIFGGEHGDYPLRAANAHLLAEAFATSSDSAIFDTSLMNVAERTSFFTEFAETFRRKNKGWVRFVIDEAHLFMPQAGAKSGGAVPAMLHAGNNLVSLGRSRGLRVAMISQRASKLHKDSLTQASTLIAMRLMHPLDRGAVEDWVSDQADPGEGKKVIASLSHLKDGEAWVWAPMAKMLEQIQFHRPVTFDSSSAPDDDAGEGPTLSPINLDALKGRLATVEAETKANDPKALKAEVARLTGEIAKLRKAGAGTKTLDPGAIKAARAEGHAAGVIDGRSAAVKALGKFARDITNSIAAAKEGIERAANLMGSYADFIEAMAAEMPTKPATIIPRNIPAPPPPRIERRASEQTSGVRLPPGERAVLVAAAQFGRIEREQLTVLTGYKRSSRDAYIHRLREKGFIELEGSTIRLTADGEAALPADYEPLPTGFDLQAYWLGRLPEGERRVLEVLVAAYPESVSRVDIDAATGYQRSSRDAYLQRMKSKRLWEVHNGGVRATDALFG